MWSDSVRAPSSAGGQPDDNSIVWNTDDERDYSDYEYSPPSPMAHYPGPREPLARFMADGRSFPRKVSVMDAVEMRRERVRESRRRGAATLKRRRLAAASADAAAGRPAE